MSGATGAVASDQLSPAEEKYFSTGGVDTSALEPPAQPGPEGAAAPAEPPAPDAGSAAPAAPGAANPAMPATDDELIAQFEQEALDGQGKQVSGGQFIRRENFRVVSTKYKQTKEELKAERENRQKIETEANELRQRFARMDERLRLFNEALQAPPADQQQQPAAPKPMPDPTQDIFGAFQWLADQNKTLTERLEQAHKQTGEVRQSIDANTAETQLRSAYGRDAATFAQANPDFGQAYTHYLRVRHATLDAAGYTDPAQRGQIIQQEERDIVERAFKAGKSPASVIYGIAKQIGYTKPADPPAPAGSQAPAPQGQAAPQAPAASKPAAPAAPSAADEVNRLAAAQAASRSLSPGGGTAVVQMTIDQLLAMTEQEFAAYERANPGVVKALMGG